MRNPLPRVSRRGKVTIAVVGAALVLLIIADRMVDLWVDWRWFSEVGYTNVFGGLLRTKIWLFLLFGVLVGGFVGGNLYLAYRLRPLIRANSPEQHALERYRMVLSPRIGLWIGLLAGLIALFAGLSGQGHWQQWMLFNNGGSFNVADPQFNVDVGFYVFRYPFWRYLLDVGFTATSLAVLGALALHYLYGGVRLQGSGDRMTAAARAHLTALVAAFVILKAIAYFLDQKGLVLAENGGTDVWGGGYTDINAVLPAKEILAYISIVVAIAILVFSNAGTRNLIWAGASLALLGIAAVAIGGIYPAAVQQFTVKPNIRDREADYIQRSITGTRQAYGLSGITPQVYDGMTATPPASLLTDTTVVPTIRLLDPNVVNPTFANYQQIRSFYDFNDKLDIDRYAINGQLQDFVVGVREINYSALSGQQTNWQNHHTVYTHGYGFVAAPANTTCDGAPFFVSGLISSTNQDKSGDSSTATSQCVASSDTIKVDQPRIYYGELAGDDDYLIVGKANGAADPEFDRPAGSSQEEFSYTGTGGVPISSFLRRLAYGIHFREANFLLSDVFNENSKIIYVRNPRERVEAVAPFLTFDTDPYPAVVDGRVTWILDGYTTSATYPYSQRVDLRDVSEDAQSNASTLQVKQNINYIRNSVKATVDAYDGTVKLYAFDESDPIMQAWNKAFGGDLIRPTSEIPPDLAAHFRYPEDLFKVQRDVLSRYHVNDPRQFNGGQDFWQVPTDPAHAASSNAQPPYYLLTQFPGAQSSRFQLTAALTPINRTNLGALLSGVIDKDGRLKLELLRLPNDTRTLGPGQAFQQMNNDLNVRSQITLLQGQANSSNASQVIYGNLLSLPYANGLLYVQPVYVQATADKPYPLLKLVLVTYGSQVGYAETLQGALAMLVHSTPAQPAEGDQQPPPTTNPPPTSGSGLSPAVAAAAQKIQAAIDALQAAQKAGDFAAQGKALADLDAATKEFEAALATASPAPTTTPAS